MRAHRSEEEASVGRYSLGRVLGQGAMGIVFMAFDKAQRRNVALKTLLPQAKAKHRRALLMEAQLLRQLHHPGILPLLDMGECDNGKPFYTMPLVQGRSLEHYLTEGLLSLRQAVRILTALCDALQHAHNREIIHCDLKSGNVLITPEQETFLIDWGTSASFLAPRMEDGKRRPVYGTPLYIAPEVLAGDPPTPAADMYALGVLLYQCLTGEFPVYDDDIMTLFRKTQQANIVSPSQKAPHLTVPPKLEEICMRLLARSPHQRYSSCFDVYNDLDGWLNSFETPQTPRPRWFAPPTHAMT
ncbi:MAG: serine/threonine protein kinase [Deltaproteobacteria bacterium]|nr:MAG: serine/threonine protein kinase [Deltaproteobacteria bacterium]